MNKKLKKDKIFTFKISITAIIAWLLAIFVICIFVKDHFKIKELQNKISSLETSQIATDELAVLSVQFSYELSERVDEITANLP